MKGTSSFLGIVARNEVGDVVEAHAFKVSTYDPLIAELMAVKKTISVSLQNGWRNIVCESDAKIVVLSLNGGSTKDLHWSTEPLFREIFSLCSLFDSVCLVWCNRTLNRFTHIIAKSAAVNDFVAFFDCLTFDRRGFSSS